MDMSGVGSDYNFLNDYISKIVTGSRADDKVLEDQNDFYDTSDSEDDQDVDNGIQYGTRSDEENTTQDDAEDEVSNDDATDNSNADEDVSSIIYGSGDTGSIDDVGGMTPDEEFYNPSTYSITGGRLSSEIVPTSDLSKKISDKESQGKYTALNTKGGGAGAVGKYQFRWNVWKDSIEKVTGVKNREQFRQSPAAQEKYYKWYEQHVLAPEVKKLQPYNKKHLSNEQLAKLVHFRGAGGAKKYLRGQLSDKPEVYNQSISSYIGTKQAGGMVVASNAAAQNIGLNHPSFDSMMFPMTGDNEFRGLDNGEPVYLEDETGKKKVLHGRHQKAKMTGKVYEKRIK